MDCQVTLEAAVEVYDVTNVDEAVSIAIAKTGEMLNPDLNYVEISELGRECPSCGEEHRSGFVAADEALVGLELEFEIYTVESEEHARRVARKEVGQRLKDVPLTVSDVVVLEDTDEDSSPDASDSTSSSSESSEDEELPEFDELMEG